MPRRAEPEPHLNQISAHLLRPEIDDPAAALVDPAELDRYELRPETALSGPLYVKRGQPSPPSWRAFLNTVVDRPLDEYANEHVSAVMFVRRRGQTVALTFGFGRHLLDADALEPDFGLKVAAGLVDPEELIAIDSRLVQSRSLQVRRQAGRGASARDLGVDTHAEMVRALSGRVLDNTLGSRISGADAVGLAGRTDVPSLILRLDKFLDAYNEKHYQQRFPVLDRWLPIHDRGRKGDLDQALVTTLQRHHQRITIGVPEIVDWQVAGFRFSREDGATRHAVPDLADYLAVREKPELRDLRRDRLFLVGPDSDEPLGSWSVYRTIEWATERDHRVYFLAAGGWYEIEADFLKRVDARLKQIDNKGVDRPDFDPREWEADYNARLARYRPGRCLLDAKFAYFEDEAGRVEICDVFTSERDFVHVKRDFEAAALSQLFAQGAVSAELFNSLPAYRERVRELLAGDPALAALIPAEAPSAQSFRVAFGIVSTQPERVPMDLPVFSRVHLAQMADQIQRQGFRLTIFGIATRGGARSSADGPTAQERREADRGAAGPLAVGGSGGGGHRPA
jgi:uncharacterized protein (TIGR04141 family)